MESRLAIEYPSRAQSSYMGSKSRMSSRSRADVVSCMGAQSQMEEEEEDIVLYYLFLNRIILNPHHEKLQRTYKLSSVNVGPCTFVGF